MINVIHYILIPFKIILFMILIIVAIYVLKRTNGDGNITTLIIQFCKFAVHYLMSYNIEISDEDYNKYMRYLYSDEKFLCVFNHISSLDGLALLSIFPKMGFVLNRFEEYNYINFDDIANEKMGGLFVNTSEKNNTTCKIAKKINERKSGDNILFISPSAGTLPVEMKNIARFSRKGAFINKSNILPILIKFQDNSLSFYNKKNIFGRIENFIKIFLPENYTIKIKVGNMIYAYENESIEEYQYRVYEIMNQQYKEL
jgi:hypothetical protein